VNVPIEWLLSGEPFVEYRTRLDLLGQADADADVRTSRGRMIADPRIVELIREVSDWPGDVVSSHKNASQRFHKLTFLADLGVTVKDPGVAAVAEAITNRRSDDGPFQILMNIPRHYGGSGTDEWAWALCDAPLTVYAMAKMGLAADARVRAAITHLAGLVRENGWPCAVSRELGSFRGPGRKSDACPFASLAMLKALSQFDDLRHGPECHVGAESLLNLWNESTVRHPYMFYMGTDFRKLKAPFVWYDLLHVLDVLSRLPWVAEDVRFQDVMDTLRGKADSSGCFTAESVWIPWKAWEFGQKREPSRWITMLAGRIQARVDGLCL